MAWLGRKRHRSFALDSGGLVHYSHAGTYTALNNDVADIPDAWYEHVWDLVNEALGL